MINIKTCWLILFWVLYLLAPKNVLLAQQEKPNINFEILTTEQGLSNNYITSISQDSFGFVWIGTTNGLCRYDSKETFSVFNQDNSGLKSNNIRALLVDSNNKLWVGTILGGLSCYDPDQKSWTTYQNDPNDQNSLSNNEVLSIFEDSKGRIWVGTELGLNLFSTENNNFKNWRPKINDPHALANKAVLDIQEDANGFIWIGLWDGGLHLILNSDSENPDLYKFRHFSLSENLAAANVWKILLAQDDKIWIGTHGGGIFVMDLPENVSNKESNQNWDLEPISINMANNQFIESNTIDDILQDNKGDFWFATTNGLHHLPNSISTEIGSDNFNPNKLKFNNYKISENNNDGVINNIINKISLSKDGLIWVGTISGISYFSNNDKIIDFYKINSLTDVNFLNNNFIIHDSSLLITTANNKITKFDIKEKEYSEITVPGIDKSTKLYALSKIENNKLLICTNKGFIEYFLSENKTIEYNAPKYIIDQTNQLLGRGILKDNEGVIYITTEFGLVTYSYSENKFELHKTDPYDDSSISDNAITEVFQDSNNEIWVATYNGLNKLIKKNDGSFSFKKFINTNGELKYDFKSNQILSLTEIEKILYIGTSNGFSAINLITEEKPNFEIPSFRNYIISLEKDLNDNLWFSTSEGINSYNTKSKVLSKYNLKDGLYDLSFRLLTSYSGEDGNAYFASQHGIAKVNTNFDKQKINPPPVYVTEIKTINRDKEETISVLNKEKIILDPNNYYLEIDFVALNYDRIEDNSFAYKLEGLDEDWFYTEKLTSAVYTNLKPGKYTFKAKAANYQGVWNEEGAAILIEKKPSLLETNWIQVLLIIFSLFLIWYTTSLYTKNIKKKNETLKDFNNSLNEEIQERMKVEKDLLQTNKDLQQFAYSASHDLQEPLRNIGNAVGLLKRKNDFDDKSNEYVDIAVDGVKRMSSLIQNLLNYAKTGSTNITLDETNLNDLLKDKLKGLTALIEEKKANILITDLPTIFCESNQVGVVFYNLINNAIKFNNKENPQIEIGISENGPVGKWQFYVKDNGIGIQPEYQNRIFNMFTRLENKRDYEGTGIGLTLCQKIITRHNGTIWVSSIPKKGSTFFFTIDKNLNQEGK